MDAVRLLINFIQTAASFKSPTTTAVVVVVLLVLWYLVKARYFSPVFFEEFARESDRPGHPYRNVNTMDDLVNTPDSHVKTLADLWNNAVALHGARRFMGTRGVENVTEEWNEAAGKNFEKITGSPSYTWITYNEAEVRVSNFSNGLASLGVKFQQNLSIFADTKPEWLMAAHACFRRGFVVATMYPSLGDDAVVYALNQTESSFLILDGALVGTVVKNAKKIKNLKTIIYMGALSKGVDIPKEFTAYTFEQVEEIGRTKSSTVQRAPEPNDLAVIMYTSGSTDLPKGVMIEHRNLLCAVAGMSRAIYNFTPDEVYIGYLPLAHVLELAAENVMISGGASIGYSSPNTLSDVSPKVAHGTHGDVAILRPTVMAAVPLILDRIRKGVETRIQNSGPIVRALYTTAYSQKWRALQRGGTTPIWDALVFKKIRGALGGRVRLMLSGGAPLSPSTQQFMNVVFCPVGQGYGLTETCGAGTICHRHDMNVGRAGPPLTSCEIKLVDWADGGYTYADKDNAEIGKPRGEICIGGNNVTRGYYKLEGPDAANYKEENGMRYFYTGDIGEWDADGVLRIIDRKKDLVKLSHGEYISLGKVEACLKESPLVENVMVYANSLHTYCIAVVAVVHKKIEDFAREKGVSGNFEAVCGSAEVNEEVLKSITAIAKKAGLKGYEIPTKVIVAHELWTPESDLVTQALKIKRNNIVKYYKKQLDKQYT